MKCYKKQIKAAHFHCANDAIFYIYLRSNKPFSLVWACVIRFDVRRLDELMFYTKMFCCLFSLESELFLFSVTHIKSKANSFWVTIFNKRLLLTRSQINEIYFKSYSMPRSTVIHLVWKTATVILATTHSKRMYVLVKYSISLMFIKFIGGIIFQVEKQYMSWKSGHINNKKCRCSSKWFKLILLVCVSFSNI